MSAHRDRWIDGGSDDLRLLGYRFPCANRRILCRSIRSVRCCELGALRAERRIWRSANPRYRASLDPTRPTKQVGLSLGLGTVRPSLPQRGRSRRERSLHPRAYAAPCERAERGPPNRLRSLHPIVAIVVAAAAALTVFALPAQAARSAAPPCRRAQKPSARVAHVIWIWMENRSFDQIIGSRSAPFINALARTCGLATNYRAVAHPSLPNYIAATSGGTWGIGDDGPPAAHPLAVASIFEQARSARSYEESMPVNCGATGSGDYAVKHNPEAYYTRIRNACTANDVPLGTPAAGALAQALATNALPAFAFVTPNLCYDMHDCPTASGDHWLARWLPTITASPAYRAGDTVVFITWDENDGANGNQVATIVVSPSTRPGTRSSEAFTHYSLLRTTEELLGIRAHLGLATGAASMRTAFNL